MDKQNEQMNQITQSERVKELVKSDIFQELLQILALRVKELDTVRDIDDVNNLNKIAIRQIAKKLAIEKIESWLDDILGISNFSEYVDRDIEKQDDIFKRLK